MIGWRIDTICDRSVVEANRGATEVLTLEEMAGT